MPSPFSRRSILPWVILLAAVIAVPTIVLAQPQPCAPEVGCIDLTQSPATLAADVLVDGAPAAGQANTVRLIVAPNVPHTIELTNYNDAAPGFNDLFNYNPARHKAKRNTLIGGALNLARTKQRDSAGVLRPTGSFDSASLRHQAF